MRYLLLITALIFTACAKDRVQMLTDRTEAYNRSIRWASLSVAGSLMKEDSRRTLLERVSRNIDGQRVVDYSIIDLGVDEKKRNASVLVEYSFYGLADGNLNYRQELQVWTFDGSKRDWFLSAIKPIPARP